MSLIELQEHLRISRCPYCGVDRPNLAKIWESWTHNSEGRGKRFWRAYACARFGGLVTAYVKEGEKFTAGIFPFDEGTRSKDIPAKPRAYLEQAIASLHAPAGAIMLAASSLDAMLKEKGLTEGSLYARIDNAAAAGHITAGMAEWAHQVRLDANDQRHADENSGLPTEEDAKRAVRFTEAFAEFLYVLPAMVARGIEDSKPQQAK
jgi:hypothetical protein